MALTHGTEIPTSGETGNQFCPKLENNWTRLVHIKKFSLA